MKTLAVSFVLVLLLGGMARAQLVADGATNIISGGTNLIEGDLTVGTNNSFTVLTFQDGAFTSNQFGFLGLVVGANSNAVTVTGAGSQWTNSRRLTVGEAGAFNWLIVKDGGAVFSQSGTIGHLPGADGNNVSVSDADTLWRSGGLTIGSNGAGNHLSITAGATVQGGDSVLGRALPGSNNVVTVSGPGSRWNNNNLTVGSNSSGNRLLLLEGASASNRTAIVGRSPTSHSNTVVVSGPGTVWTNGYVWFTVPPILRIGDSGAGNRLVVSNGAQIINSGDSQLGVWEGSDNNEAIVTGTGSLWAMERFLTVGASGALNTVTVEAGARLVSSNATIGAASASNQVVITGESSRWDTWHVTLGDDLLGRGNGNALWVTDGASVNGCNTTIGAGNGSNNLVAVVGAGSTYSHVGSMMVGFSGANNLLLISNGGFVASESFKAPGSSLGLGDGFGSRDNRAIVSGTGSTWIVTNTFYLGDRTGTNHSANHSVTVENGATLETGLARIGWQSSENQVYVSGPSSSWLASSNIDVGWTGASNLLWITNGGRVSSLTGILGNQGTSTDNLVVVSGSGSSWSNQASLRLGIFGDRNTLRVHDGGLVASSNLMIGSITGPTNNWIHNDGGHIVATHPNGNGFLGVRGGVLSLNGGITVADRLLVGSQGVLRGNGFITVTVANSVTNFGLIQPGQSLGTLALSSGVRLQNGGTVEFEIAGPAAGTGYDVFNVAGAAELGGVLKLALAGGFYPGASDSFVVMNYGSASSAFANVADGQRLNTADNLGSFLVTVGPTSLVVGNYVSPDTDGDGQTDYAEFLAGTDANDPASALVITSFVANGVGHVVLRFPFVEGKSYRVLYCDGFPNGSWTAINSPVITTPAPGFHEWVDDGSLTGGLNVSNRTYRIGLQ